MKKWIVFLLLLGLSLAFLPIAGAGVKDIVKIGSDLVVKEGMRVGDAVAIGGDVTVNGVVDGDAVAVGGSVILGPRAVVDGDAVSVGGTIKKEEGAIVYGDEVEVDIIGIPWAVTSVCKGIGLGLFWPFRIVVFIGFLALALLIVAIIPKPIGKISTAVEKNTLKVFLWGLLGMVLIVPLVILLAVSVVGIVLIPVEIILVGCAFLVGYIAVAQLIGNRMALALKKPDLNMLWGTLWGIIILGLVGWVPFLGWLVKVVASVLGLGGVIMALLSTRKS
ncbi:hypothetical protein ISS37_08525 [candidate division KSB1 bacterium]|nr:hypothetical protein [candidate division KSB1 bacterium]